MILASAAELDDASGGANMLVVAPAGADCGPASSLIRLCDPAACPLLATPASTSGPGCDGLLTVRSATLPEPLPFWSRLASARAPRPLVNPVAAGRPRRRCLHR